MEMMKVKGNNFIITWEAIRIEELFWEHRSGNCSRRIVLIAGDDCGDICHVIFLAEFVEASGACIRNGHRISN